jgi:hypothetical protein
MRLRTIAGAALVVTVVGASGPVFAQTNDEVKQAIERAVGASISSAVAESLSRSIVSEGIRQMPSNTVFGGPFYNRLDGDSFDADTFGGVVGALFKVHDLVLVHGSLAGASTSLDSTGAADIGSSFFNVGLGGTFVFLNTEPVKAWATLEGGFSNFDSDGFDDIWSWRVSPSATASVRLGGPFLIEPSVGFAFSNTFEDDNADTVTTFLVGASLKYRGEKFRPQFNVAYQRIIDPDLDDDGFISFGPLLLYAVRPNVLVGAAYTFGTSLTSGVDVDSHTVTLELRWTF